jgi:outer membrane biosynthesis protein TonB
MFVEFPFICNGNPTTDDRAGPAPKRMAHGTIGTTLGYAPGVERDREEIVRELTDTTADKVAEIVEAAERKATEIEREARAEAERIVSAAREEAKEQVERAQGAVSRLVEQADELRAAVGKLGSEFASGRGIRAETPTPEPEITPQPPRVPEPEPPREPEPTPPRTPEPQPPPTPEPQPPDVPEPQPPGPEIEGRPSTEAQTEQLKGGAAKSAGSAAATAESGDNGADSAAAGGGGEADAAAARLVAMKMALDGSSREEVDRHLTESYGPGDRSALLDEVFSRAGK